MLRTAERVFQIHRNVSRRSRAPDARATPLLRMMTRLQRRAAADDHSELSAEDLAQPINCTSTTFDCAVTGEDCLLSALLDARLGAVSCAGACGRVHSTLRHPLALPLFLQIVHAMSRGTLASSHAISWDLRTLTSALPCAFEMRVGRCLPLAEAHIVTLKQLLHYSDFAQEVVSSGNVAARSTTTPPSEQQQQQQQQRHRVPEVIQRALPGIRTRDYRAMRKRTAFLLSRTYVCEEAAIALLKAGLEVRLSHFENSCTARVLELIQHVVSSAP